MAAANKLKYHPSPPIVTLGLLIPFPRVAIRKNPEGRNIVGNFIWSLGPKGCGSNDGPAIYSRLGPDTDPLTLCSGRVWACCAASRINPLFALQKCSCSTPKSKILTVHYHLFVGIKNFVLQNLLHLPYKLYEQLVGAAAEGDPQLLWQQTPSEILTKMESFLEKKKRACLLAYEDRVCSGAYLPEIPALVNESHQEFESSKQSVVTRTQLRKF